MKITLYNTDSEQNRLNKNLTELLVVDNAKILDTSNLLKFDIVIKRDLYKDFKRINYVYVDSFNRYYFANATLDNAFIVLSCEVDALMSNKSEILSLNATVDRNEFLKNGYLQDDMYKTMAYEEIVCKSFPSGLTSDSIILMTVG